MSAQGPQVTTADQFSVGGVFGNGMEYFNLDPEDRAEWILANAETLEEDEWKTLSDTVVQIYHEQLNAVQDLRDAGLVRNISLATIFDQWQDITAFTEADISMDGESRSNEDRPSYSTNSVPIPIIHKDFRISERELMSSRALNNDLRTDAAAAATRQVVQKAEELLTLGWISTLRDDDGNTAQIDGYTTATNRNTVSGSDWGTASNIRTDTVSALDAMDDDNRTPGDTGFWYYIAPPQWQQFRSTVDPDGDGNLTVRERILDEFEQEIGAVRRNEQIPDGEAILVDPKSDVVELAVAEDTQVVEWQSGSGMTNHFKVMTAMAPEIKSDAGNRSGVVHLTGI